jgi:cell division protein FtsL
MNETESSGTEPKKMVNRNTAIALGIICIVMIASLGGVIALYSLAISDRDNTIASKDNQIASLNTQISQLNSNLTHLQNQVASLNTTISSLTSNLTALQKIANMQDSTILYDKSNPSRLNHSDWTVLAGSLPDGWLEGQPVHTDYAGYVKVDIVNSASNSTNVRLWYSFNGFNYDNTMSVGSSGYATFPILPSTGRLNIVVANADASSLNIARIIVTYYY